MTEAMSLREEERGTILRVWPFSGGEDNTSMDRFRSQPRACCVTSPPANGYLQRERVWRIMCEYSRESMEDNAERVWRIMQRESMEDNAERGYARIMCEYSRESMSTVERA
jgi:hypothetical protein